jgi:DNA-binding NarL/FixJ family response regulator
MRTPRTRVEAEAIQLGSLSLREVDVSVLVTAGLTDKQVGEELGFSPARVSHYLIEIFRKLDLSSPSGLIIFGSRHDPAVRSRSNNHFRDRESSAETQG